MIHLTGGHYLTTLDFSTKDMQTSMTLLKIS